MYVVYFWAWLKYSTVVIDGMLGRQLEGGCSKTTQIERQWATNINIALNSPNAFPMETNPLDSSPNQELKALLNDWALQKTTKDYKRRTRRPKPEQRMTSKCSQAIDDKFEPRRLEQVVVCCILTVESRPCKASSKQLPCEVSHS